jgi:hypothetical protein
VRMYTYVFIRQDLSIEQQMVQIGHVCMKLGVNVPDANADTTHFVLVGVRNEEALLAVESILDSFDFDYVMFEEDKPKAHFTAIATHPIPENRKGPLRAFNILQVNLQSGTATHARI